MRPPSPGSFSASKLRLCNPGPNFQDVSGLAPELRCTALRPGTFEMVLSANLTTSLFNHVLTVHSLPAQVCVRVCMF